jgi:hypothetical protein
MIFNKRRLTMKCLFLGLLLMSCVAAAGTVTALKNPAVPPNVPNIHWMHCASIGFNADHSIHGACQVSYGSSCGRYCSNPGIFYAASWDIAGDPVLGPQCASYSAARSIQIIYVSGYSAATCSVIYNPTGTVVTVNGGYFYYVTTDPVSGAELVNSNSQSYLFTP